jgi:hypothetical protein
VKIRWLIALAGYAVASAGALAASRSPLIENDAPLHAVRQGWMLLVLAAAGAVWFSARTSVHPAHTEISIALALGAAAFPFASIPEPDRLSLWINSSAAAFVLVFSGVLGWRAFARQREELDVADADPLIRDS